MTLQPVARKRASMVLLSVGLLLAAERVISWTAAHEPPEDDLAPLTRAARAAAPPSPIPVASASEVRTERPAPALQLERLKARDQTTPAGAVDLFAVPGGSTPGKAKPTIEQVAAAALPSTEEPVPAFPYRYMGGMVDEGVRLAYFLQGERVLALRAGDVVDRKFRVDEVASDHISLTFLPRNAPVTVNLGAAR